MLIWSHGAFISALALSLLHSLWQGALLGLLGLALNVRLRDATPDVRCGAFSLLLFTIFAVWLGTFCCLYGAQTRPAVFSGTIPGGPSDPKPLSGPPAIPAGHVALPLLQSISPILVDLWAMGVCVLSLRHFGGILFLRRLYRSETTPCPPAWEACAERIAARMGIHRKIRLFCSARIDVPFAFGLFKSSILLPVSAMTGLTSEQAEALIAHELAHFARHDVLLNLIQVCIETVLFYHPVVRWLSVQIRAAREQHCDDLAIQVIGDRAVYARALYCLEEARAPIPQLALGAKGDTSQMTNTHLLRRIQRVLGVAGPERRDPWTKGALALGAATIGLATLLPVQAYSPQQSGKPSDAPAASQTHTSQTITRMKILLNLNGDKIELNGTDLTPSTPIKVNGKEGRFGDLTPQQQKELHQALKTVPHVEVRHLFVDPSNGGSSNSSVHVFTNTKILLNLNGDKIELNTTNPTADTPVKVNGTVGRFGDLNAQQQQQIREHMPAISVMTHAGLSSDVLGEVRDAIKGLNLPENVKVQVIEQVEKHTADDPHTAPTQTP